MKEEKVMCNYDCEQCGKNYNDELYPDDPSDCCYCPDCRAAKKLEMLVKSKRKKVDDAVSENFGHCPQEKWFDDLLAELKKVEFELQRVAPELYAEYSDKYY